MGYKAEDFKRFQENALGPNDTFKFTCKQCGSCCRNRDDAILITGVDVFYLAKELGIEPLDVLEQYTNPHIGQDSRVPVFTLRERLDGSCVLLRNGRCTVHKSKPVPCALYPLGRMLIGDAEEYTYFNQDRVCERASKNAEEHTLREWLNEFNIPQRDKEGIAWMKLFAKFSEVLRKLNKETDIDLAKKVLGDSLECLYSGFDTTKDLYEQIQKNIEGFKVTV